LKAKTLEIEDYTNYNYNARLVAGMHGFTFMQVFEGLMVTDLFKKRTFMEENKYRVIDCPYTGKKILTVPAANPDVCILHVQRADKFGNAQYWGSMGSVAAAALASKTIIVSCEEIVDHEIIKSSPHHTIIPAFRTQAVIEVPWGAHPTEVLGYYNRDRKFYGVFSSVAKAEDTMKAWMDEWVFGCENREAYLARYRDVFGQENLDQIRAKEYLSTPVNYGSAYTSPWNDENRERTLGLTLEEIEAFMAERGMLHG
jgi:glutaconate CoA-transferase subunit A